ncbi:YcaO-like family protein [Streptomyces collinus]|uniref:YcaO-like family protein n=1 Tax=Streptomyces collinus TaxID=42684 RepID=UPI00368EA676
MSKSVVRGTHRAVPPRQTWARVRPFLPAMGITRVAEVTGLDDIGIPVFQAVRPGAKTLSVSQGKGITAELALVSAVMESIEFWHAEEVPPAPLQAAVGEMAPGLPYSVFDLPQHPRSVLSPSTMLEWVAARPVGEAGTVWVPQDCVRLDSTRPDRWSPPGLRSNTNGLASGNTLEEALLHGLYEVLERDLRARAPKGRDGLEVDLATVTGASAELIERFHAAEVDVRVHDLTSASGIPCYEAFIWSPHLPARCGGCGCHRDPDVALSRALTEAAQSRATLIAGAREDIPEDSYELMSMRARLVSPFTASLPARSFPQDAAIAGSFGEDLGLVAETVAQRARGGVFWIDLTRPEFDIPVVKVIAPGLLNEEH